MLDLILELLALPLVTAEYLFWSARVHRGTIGNIAFAGCFAGCLMMSTAGSPSALAFAAISGSRIEQLLRGRWFTVAKLAVRVLFAAYVAYLLVIGTHVVLGQSPTTPVILADHEARIRANERAVERIAGHNIDARLAVLEKSVMEMREEQIYQTRLNYVTMIGVLGYLLRDVFGALRKKPQE